ncbi:ABC transporter permease subunit [Roseicella frigidaeris]|uniref:ABC transporter permease n=1 Tax=Roseicella frigidaeris TaxID=2230885 RepID=A0A327LYC0_9PROT|nr:ABC transporter permease subunit [Roseicella frigidaeris]RAI55174.1 ABC transporter permease [Roseicella frigidaeris]
MKAVLLVAEKEIHEGIRNRWVVAATLLLAALALTLTFLGAAPAGRVGVGALEVVVVSLSSLSVFLLPLIALLLSHDAVVGEMERGTLLLLLTYPLARWQVLLGKFLGQVAILALATVLGYGAAAAALVASGAQIAPDGWWAFGYMIGSSVLLGAAFVALGTLASTLVRDRGAAAGIAVGLWLLLVLLWDMGLLGLLVADQGEHLSGSVVDALLLLNPADAYRLFNLAGLADVRSLTGMAAMGGESGLSPSLLLAALVAWALLPLAAAAALFSRREL